MILESYDIVAFYKKTAKRYLYSTAFTKKDAIDVDLLAIVNEMLR